MNTKTTLAVSLVLNVGLRSTNVAGLPIHADQHDCLNSLDSALLASSWGFR